MWAPSRARRLARARSTWLVVAAIASVGAVAALSGELTALAEERRRWSEPELVLVMKRDVASGESLAGATTAVEVPVHLLSDAALTVLPAGAVAVDAIYGGEIVHAERVRAAGDGGLAPGHVTVTVAVAGTGASVEAGHVVDLWRVDAGNDAGDRVANAARVVSVVGDEVTVSVPAEQVERLAVAALSPIVAVRTG